MGNVVVKYKYDAWGNHKVLDAAGAEITSSSHIGNKNPFRYRGYYYDTETGLYYLQTRYYDPAIGRFLNMDSINYANPESISGLNLYAYCGNNPVMNVDPTGEFAITAFALALILGIGAGAVVGGTVAGVSAYNQGARGWDLVGSILGGAIFGGGMGAVMVIGGAAGLASIGISVAGYSITTTAAAFWISTAIGVGAGLFAYTAETLISPSRQWSWREFVASGISGAFKGAATFTVAFYGGKFGAFDKMFLKGILGKELVKDVFAYDFAKAMLASIISNAGRRFFTQAAYYLGESLVKISFVSAIAAGARWIIDNVFGT